MSFDVVSAYTLLVGDGDGPPSVSVHSTADEAWRALDKEVRSRCWMRPRPRRKMDAEAATRFWNVAVHRLPVPLPVIARPATVGAAAR